MTSTSRGIPSASPSTAIPTTVSASVTSPSGGCAGSGNITMDGELGSRLRGCSRTPTASCTPRRIGRSTRSTCCASFPRLPLYDDFDLWADMGQELLDLHIGFERVEPYPLERRDAKREAGKARLRADKERGVITLDERTTLPGVPAEAWEYRLGSRSALEWVLDQYKEKKPRDPTIPGTIQHVPVRRSQGEGYRLAAASVYGECSGRLRLWRRWSGLPNGNSVAMSGLGRGYRLPKVIDFPASRLDNLFW